MNGSEIGSLSSEGTEFDDIKSYLRLNLIQGLERRPGSNGITYKDWLDHLSIYAFDLSTSGKCSESMDFFSPVIRTGDVRIEVGFSNETPLELQLMAVCEYPSLMTIDKKRKISMSYYTTG